MTQYHPRCQMNQNWISLFSPVLHFFSLVILLCPLPGGAKATVGLTRLLLAYMWNSSSMNLSAPLYKPWTISWCTWALPQTQHISKVCQLCCSPSLWSKSAQPPNHNLTPRPHSNSICRHPLPFCAERLTAPEAKSLYICSTWLLLYDLYWLTGLTVEVIIKRYHWVVVFFFACFFFL